MSIRRYLIFSYLALVLLVTFGMYLLADTLLDKLTEGNLRTAEAAILDLTTTNYRLSKELLTADGENFVAAKAEAVAKGIAWLLSGTKSYDYARLRRDKLLRKVATQDLKVRDEVVGYMDLIDNQGVSVLHPNREVEGKNFSQWQEQFPEMWQLVQRSFTQQKVAGYYTFLDRDNQKRQKFMALVQVPGTPFIVVAAVNIDRFFLPIHEKIRQQCQETMAKARASIEQVSDDIDHQAKIVGLLVGLGFGLVGGIVGLYFAGTISRPIRQLRDGVEAVGEGNFAVAVPEKGVQEVVQLAHSFNLLGQQLTEYIEKRDFIRDTFGRYVTQEVVKKLLESKEALELGGETREVSIMMSDLRGFTAIIAQLTPEQVIVLLNRYLGRMIEILLDQKAVIDEILGDGILAFFGAPEPLADHPARAVAGALAMQAAMAEVNALNLAEGLPHLEMGIAVHTGSVVVGNIGSERRTKYSIVGSDVNFASRMEAFALGGQVLISAATYDRIRDLVEVGGSLQVEMKGLAGTATLYEVRGMHGPYHLRLPKRRAHLVELPERLGVEIACLREKIVTGTPQQAWLTHLSETAATVVLPAELEPWQDVRLSLLDRNEKPLPGYIYGKVTRVQPLEGEGFAARLNFTSVAPELYPVIRQLTGQA